MPVRTVLCSSFDDFVANVRPERFVFERFCRGQAHASWPLSSIWERWLRNRFPRGAPSSYASLFGGLDLMLEARKHHVEQFRDNLFELALADHVVADDVNALWCLGRHHGLVTPLLDWTRNPFVAAFFAFFSRAQQTSAEFRHGPGVSGEPIVGWTSDPIAVWELYQSSDLARPDEFDIFSVQQVYSSRQRAQEGLFTVLTHETFLDVAAYLEHRGISDLLTCYQIPGTSYSEAFATLRQMGVVYRKLFPDFDGAAADANLASLMQGITTVARCHRD